MDLRFGVYGDVGQEYPIRKHKVRQCACERLLTSTIAPPRNDPSPCPFHSHWFERETHVMCHRLPQGCRKDHHQSIENVRCPAHSTTLCSIYTPSTSLYSLNISPQRNPAHWLSDSQFTLTQDHTHLNPWFGGVTFPKSPSSGTGVGRTTLTCSSETCTTVLK